MKFKFALLAATLCFVTYVSADETAPSKETGPTQTEVLKKAAPATQQSEESPENDNCEECEDCENCTK